jgi:hypothetical protein
MSTVHMLFAFTFCIPLYVYLQLSSHNVQNLLHVYYLVLFIFLHAVNVMQGFVYEKMLKGNYNYSQDRSFLKGNEENTALVLSNVLKRTSARDGPLFGSTGPFINTSSLVSTVVQNVLSLPE